MDLISSIHNDLHKGALQLIAEHRARLYAEALGLCKNETDAEDLVIRTLDKAIRKIDTYSGSGDILSWMRSIMTNLYLNDNRAPVDRMTKVLEAETLEEYAEATNCTIDEVLRNSDSEVLHAALDHLDPEYKKVLVMHYFGELPVKNIALALNIPLGTVLWRLSVARRMLAKSLGPKLGKKPFAVLAAILLGVTTLFGAAVWGVVKAVNSEGPFASEGPLGSEETLGSLRSEGTLGMSADPVDPNPDSIVSNVPNPDPIVPNLDPVVPKDSISVESLSATCVTLSTTENNTKEEKTMNLKSIAKTATKLAVGAALITGFAAEACAEEDALPQGYVKLVSVGPGFVQWQYVNTGFTPCSTDKIEMDVTFENVDRSGAATLWCARNGSYDAINLFWEGSGKKKLTIDCGNDVTGRKAIDFSPANDERFVFTEDCKARTFAVNGEVKLGPEDFPADAFSSDRAGSTLVIFAARAKEGASPDTFSYGVCALHSFKVYDESGNLKLNLVPAYEKSSGRAGLYDTIGTNRGDQNPFIVCLDYKGNPKSESLSFVAGDAFKGGLPPNFKRVAWVSPTGSQCLNAYLRPLSTDTIEMKVSFEAFGNTYGLWSSRDGNDNGAMDLFCEINKTFTVDRGNCTANSGRHAVNADYLAVGKNYRFKVDYQASEFYVNGIETLALGSVDFSQGGSDLWLFGSARADSRATYPTCTGNGKYRCYWVKVSDANGKLKLDLVPCLEAATGIAGLYDRVAGRFMKAMCVDKTPSFAHGEEINPGLMIIVK